jgi:uncharacterized protein (TIGR02099 family)
MTTGAILKKLLNWLAYIAATGVIILALLVGTARLLLPLASEYQDEIRRWASAATGFKVNFAGISASWPLAGPELQFIDVSISTQDGAYLLLNAEKLTVGVSLLRLLRDRKFVLSRLGVSESRVELSRNPDGGFLFQGQALEELLPQNKLTVIPEIQLKLRDIEVMYIDTGRTDERLDFLVDELELDISAELIEIDGELQLPESFGRQIEISAEVPRALIESGETLDQESPEWTAYMAGEDLDVARLLDFGLAMDTPLQVGRGGVVSWVRFAGKQPLSIAVDLDMSDVAVGDSPETAINYQVIDGRFEWEARDDGWVMSASALQLMRDGNTWPESDMSLSFRRDAVTNHRFLKGHADFIRLHDIYPIITAVASAPVRESVLPQDIRGDIKGFDLNLETSADGALTYQMTMQFDRLGVVISADGLGAVGLSGTAAIDQDGGRLQVTSRDSEFNVPDIFIGPITTKLIDGFLIWRVTSSYVRVLSDSVQIVTPDLEASSRFELSFPRDGSSPFLDLTAVLNKGDASQLMRYLPLRKFPPAIGKWLSRAIVAGDFTGGELKFRGALREFPYDQGEGVFRIDFDVVNGEFDYAPGWPRIKDMSANIIFDGVSLYTRRNSGLIAGVPMRDRELRMDDIRKGILNVSAEQTISVPELLDLLRSTPIAGMLGPTFSRLNGSGEMIASMALEIPVLAPAEFDMTLDLQAQGFNLGLDGLDFGFTAIRGPIRIRNTQIHADGLQAMLLDEPVDIKIRPAEQNNSLYSHYASVKGATPIRKWTTVLNLPAGERFDGRAAWNAMAMIPARYPDQEVAPLHILVRSDLEYLSSSFPIPLDKESGSLEPMDLDIVFPEDEALEIFARLGRGISWAVRLESDNDDWMIERGAIHAGSAVALMPSEPGVRLSGQLEFLRFDDWLSVFDSDDEFDDRWSEVYRQASFNIDQLAIFGLLYRDVEVDAQRESQDWQVVVNSPGVAGTVRVPLGADESRPMVLDMDRLYLDETDPVQGEASDPRELMPMQISVEDFAIGKMRFGSVHTDVTKVSDGLMMGPVDVKSASFTIKGDGAWLVEGGNAEQQRSRLQMQLNSDDIKATLEALDYDPVLEGEKATFTADISWPGPPGADFLDHVSGALKIDIERGALLEVEPGGGRLLGVLSIAALPRRLSLDFRDVFDDGLSFDTVKGDFRLEDGEAYTCNLGLEGAVANLGIVGRTGLREEDYDQLAVVRPHVSNVFALGGAVVGGPGVGAALLLISQIFKKPLSALGESYYRISGSWDDPAIDQVERGEVDLTPFKNCEEYLATVLPDPGELEQFAPLPQAPAEISPQQD